MIPFERKCYVPFVTYAFFYYDPRFRRSFQVILIFQDIFFFQLQKTVGFFQVFQEFTIA